jgi:hypothetical protein
MLMLPLSTPFHTWHRSVTTKPYLWLFATDIFKQKVQGFSLLGEVCDECAGCTNKMGFSNNTILMEDHASLPSPHQHTLQHLMH